MPQTNSPCHLYILSAPSGAGKTSLVRALIERHRHIAVCVSHTTRPVRPGEKDGENYHFVDRAVFESMIARGDFLEYARVFDHYYGTARSAARRLRREGKDVVLEIDWQGARQVRDQAADAVSIFILPPSRHALRERLTRRGQDSAETIDRRMLDAVRECSHYNEYDYLVVNDDFDAAVGELAAIITAQRLRLRRQRELRRGLIEELLA